MKLNPGKVNSWVNKMVEIKMTNQHPQVTFQIIYNGLNVFSVSHTFAIVCRYDVIPDSPQAFKYLCESMHCNSR